MPSSMADRLEKPGKGDARRGFIEIEFVGYDNLEKSKSHGYY